MTIVTEKAVRVGDLSTSSRSATGNVRTPSEGRADGYSEAEDVALEHAEQAKPMEGDCSGPRAGDRGRCHPQGAAPIGSRSARGQDRLGCRPVTGLDPVSSPYRGTAEWRGGAADLVP